jgi:hypothetical protein
MKVAAAIIGGLLVFGGVIFASFGVIAIIAGAAPPAPALEFTGLVFSLLVSGIAGFTSFRATMERGTRMKGPQDSLSQEGATAVKAPKRISVPLLITLAMIVAVISGLIFQIVMKHEPPAVITAPGTFASRDGRHFANISVDPQGLVSYEIVAAGTNLSEVKGKAGNAFMKFYMAWDSNDNFWIDSEDTSRVLLYDTGKFNSHDIVAADIRNPSFPQPPTEFVTSR